MKALLLNGSLRKSGCTYTALKVVASTLEVEGVAPQIFQAGERSQQSVAATAGLLKGAHALVVRSPVCWVFPSDQIIWSLRPII